MKKSISNIWAKAAAFLAVCICVPLVVGCVVCTVYNGENGIFGNGDTPFEESNVCYRFVEDRLESVRQYVYWNDISGLLNDGFYYENESFAYKIIDESGEIIIDTSTTGSYKVVENFYISEVDSNGISTKEYIATGYINLPVKYGDPAYTYYMLYTYSGNIMILGVVSFFIFLVAFFYLMISSGKNSSGEVVLIGINKIPWDLLAFVLIIPFAIVINELDSLFYGSYRMPALLLLLMFYTLILTVICLVASMSAAARFKVRGWYKNSLIYKVAAGVWHFVKWLISAIPQTWGLALVYCGFMLVNFILAICIPLSEIGPLALLAIIFIDATGLAGVIWFAVQLKSLKKAGEAISRGDFEYKVNTIGLWPGLKEHGANLNSAAEGMSKAVEAKMKSERFKTELITNVSHDLKTPLTSIVSYVDLLKKEDIQNETAKEYIEVIERQSAKLKKLTEDLVEASKASSGAITVNREKLNIGELVNQSVGEFAERLEAAEITPVVDLPEEEIFVYTDGRLLWRVFDNLIQNIIKYAQPGTRAYFDLIVMDGKAVIVMKNISREPLNMSAEMLMERFVRGDSSRGQSEGNGLGLSIAKSLTDLCGGTFEIMLDGDLYKAVVSFPLMKQQ